MAFVNVYFASERGYDTAYGRRTFEVVFPLLKGRQLSIHCSDRAWSFYTKRIMVSRITAAQMAQIKIKWDQITEI